MAQGSASITSAAAQTTINQSTNRAVINWNSFDIASGEKVQINQPGASSIELERIGGNSASSILGNLSSNGQVWLINANGILFGNGSSVNVAGLLATSSNISDANFMAGNYVFDTPGNPNASIANWGHITLSDNGLAALVGPHVTNNGLIEARLSKVQLASGDTFALDLYGDGLINLAVSPEVTSELVSNSGTITAQGGNVLLTTAAAESVVNSLVNMDGIIDADAGATGNGGTVTIKSSGTTDFSGSITAKGGTDSGNGGNVETSGAILNASGTVNTTAPNGSMGNWLLDPTDITIETGGGSSLTGSTIAPSYLVSSLNGSNITLQADDSITVSNAVDASGNASAGNLTLNAVTDNLNAPITLKTGSILSGDATTVNVGANGFVQNGIDAAASGATVNLAAATYDLTSELVINKNLTLTGQSAASTILDGQNDTRVMEIDGTSGGITANLNDLTMQHGNGVDAANGGAAGSGYNATGGGLLIYASSGNQAHVAINNSTLYDNAAHYGGGIYNSAYGGTATLTVFNSNIMGNTSIQYGGGIFTNANGGMTTLAVNHTSIANNDAGSGGGIYELSYSGTSTNTVIDSTMSANVASTTGGGIETSNYGTTTLNISNSTIAGNTSASGGAGIYDLNHGATAATNVGDTILAGNTTNGSEDDVDNIGGNLTSNGYNLFGQNGVTGGFTGNGTTDIQLSGGICAALQCSSNTLLLANNGGPTQTIALVIGSAAIDAGDPSQIGQTDQRGIVRGSSPAGTGTASDIGAYEAAILDVTANNQEIIYGQSAPSFTYTQTGGPSGQLSGNVALTTNETNAGTYAGDIGIGTLTADTGYLIDLTAGQYKIDTRTVTIDPTAGQSKIYGQSDQALTYATEAATGTTGLMNGDSLSGDIGRALGENAGTYAYTLGTLANSNYNVAIEASPPVFAITPYTLSVDASAASKTQGQPDPSLTYSYGALQNGDTASVFTGALTRAAGETDGQYAITQGSLSAGSNYSIDFTGNYLTISGGANSSPTTSASAIPASVQQLIDGTIQQDDNAKPGIGSIMKAASAVLCPHRDDDDHCVRIF